MNLRGDPQQGRISALDGWRGVAILIVLFDHIQRVRLPDKMPLWMQVGQHGVTIFFVLSGFLITTNLLGSPDLKKFYIRRVLRLMPVAVTYLCVLLAIQWVTGVPDTSLAEIKGCLLFYRNFLPIEGGAIHFWSLSLEEQFYFVWPFVLLLAGIRRSRWIASVGAVAVATWRYFHWAYCEIRIFHTEVRADALFCGCLLALLLADQRTRGVFVRWSRVAALPAAVVVLFCFFHYQNLLPLYECVAVTILIAATTLHPRATLTRCISFKPLVGLGVVSYGVYIWQELFVGLHTSLLFSMGVLLPIAVLGSYEYIEKPCINLGRRLSNRNRKANPEPLAVSV